MLYLPRENINHLKLGVLVGSVVFGLKKSKLSGVDSLVGGVVST